MRRSKWFSAVSIICIAVIASPAGADTSDQIRTFLEGLDAGDVPMVAERRLESPAILSRVYRSNNHVPLWTEGAPLHDEIADLLNDIGRSVSHGFNAERYHRPVLERLLEAKDATSTLALELLLTDAFLTQARHRGQGAVSPPNLDSDWQVPLAEIDAGELLLDTVNRKRGVGNALSALWPVDPEYGRLLQRRAEIVATGDETTVRVASGPILKPGQTSDRIIMLKERLMGPGDYSPVYDDALRNEVQAFQRAAGLEPDGIVGDNTLEVLNASRVSWIDRIDANLERWRWLPRNTPDTYVRVNIAAFTLRAIENGHPTLTMNVIVGKPYRRTPVFTETIKYLVLNPYWNVPYSIATQDKLPLLKADAKAEAAKGFETKANGSDAFVSVDAVDWSGVTRRSFNYLLRQKPGEQNALGRLKIMLPNPYAIYLHDTPSRELFARQERIFSSGCIRLERPTDLAEWLLARDDNPDAGKIESLLKKGETRTVNLRKPIPAYLVYFTAFSLDDGEVAFRRDIYDRDRVLVDALRAGV